MPAAQAKSKAQHVQLLAINDFHGHLAPNTPGSVQTGCCNPVNNSSGVQTGWTQKGEVDLDAFSRYLAGKSPLAPPAQNRITRVN